MHYDFVLLVQGPLFESNDNSVWAMKFTCSLMFWCPTFALTIHIGAEGPGEVLVHNAADVSLVVGEEDTARSQVFCLGSFLLLFRAFLWP